MFSKIYPRKELFIHCYICDKQLSEKEINFNEDMKNFECCSTCLEIAMDAAYSDGVHTEDDEFVIIEDLTEENQYQYSLFSYLDQNRPANDDD